MIEPMTNAARPPTPSDPNAGMKNSVTIRPMPKCHERETRIVDRQQLQTVEPEQQRQRADDAGQDGPGVITLEQQP